MRKLPSLAFERNDYPGYDLFTWAAENDRRHRAPHHVRRIAQRHNITESRAALVCEIAGIGGAE